MWSALEKRKFHLMENNVLAALELLTAKYVETTEPKMSVCLASLENNSAQIN